MYNRFHFPNSYVSYARVVGGSPSVGTWRETDGWGRLLRPEQNTTEHYIPQNTAYSEEHWPSLPQYSHSKPIITLDQLLKMEFPTHFWDWLPPNMKYFGGRKLRNPIPNRNRLPEVDPNDLDQTRDLARNMAKLVRIKHHLVNWKNLPWSLNNKVSSITDNIGLPLNNDQLKSQFKQAGKDFGDKLVQVSNTHLTTQAKMLVGLLSKSNLTHLPQASSIARKLLIDHFGRHLPRHIIDLLGEVETLVGVSSAVDDCVAVSTAPPDPENVPTVSNAEMGEHTTTLIAGEVNTPRSVANIPVSNRFQVLETTHMDQGEISSKKRRAYSGTPPNTLGDLELLPKNKRSKRKVTSRYLPSVRLNLSPGNSTIDKTLSKQNTLSNLDGTQVPTSNPRFNSNPNVNSDSDPSSNPHPTLSLQTNPNSNPNSYPNLNQDPNPNLNLNPNPIPSPNPNLIPNPIHNPNPNPDPIPNLDPNSYPKPNPNPSLNAYLDPNSQSKPNLNLDLEGSGREEKLSGCLRPVSVEHCEIASTSTRPGPIQPLVERTVAGKGPGDEMGIITVSEDESHSDSEELLTNRPRSVVENPSSGRADGHRTVNPRPMSEGSGRAQASLDSVRSPQGDRFYTPEGPGNFLERKDKKDRDLPLEISGETEVLLVGDSNLRLFTPPPLGWQVVCIPGLTLTQLTAILKSTLKPTVKPPNFDLTNLKHVIVSAGINDRNSGDTSSLLECLKVFRSPFRTIHFQSIIFSRNLDLHQINNLTRLNKVARGLEFVRTISSDSIKPKFKDQVQIHYDTNTARQIFENMISHITSLNFN